MTGTDAVHGLPDGGDGWLSPVQSDAVQAASISSAVADLPGVAALSAGELGQLGTFVSGRDVPGVRVDDDHVEVHIVAQYGIPLQETAHHIREAVSPLLGGRPLEVSVQDILLPGEVLPDPVPAVPPQSVPVMQSEPVVPQHR